MPGGDRTGPDGRGPRTGRGLGRANGNSSGRGRGNELGRNRRTSDDYGRGRNRR